MHPAAYAGWEQSVHFYSNGAMAAAAAAALIWVVGRLLWPRVSSFRTVAYALLGVSLIGSAVSLTAVGSAPLLSLSNQGVASIVAERLAAEVVPATPSIGNGPWANRLAADVLAHLNQYQQGRYAPPTPPGYRVVLVAAPPEAAFTPFLNHGNMAPPEAIGHEVALTLNNLLPSSTVARAAIAHTVTVGVAQGIAITYDHRIPTLLVTVLTR